MRFLKGEALLLAGFFSIAANAAEFSTKVVSWSGPWNFTAFADYDSPAIEHLYADQKLRIEGANKVAQFTIVSEAHCNPGWWLTGQSVMTIDGSLGWNHGWDPNQFLQIETTIQDLDTNKTYHAVTGLYQYGRGFGGAIQFDGAAKNIRFTDLFTLSTGPDGRFAEWVSSNHYMTASQTVPEPFTAVSAVAALCAAACRRRRTSK